MIRGLDLQKWSFEGGRVTFSFLVELDNDQSREEDLNLCFGMNKKGELLIYREGWARPIRKYTHSLHNANLIRRLLEGQGYRKRFRYRFSERSVKDTIVPKVIPPIVVTVDLSHEDEKALVLMEERLWKLRKGGA